MPPDKAPVAQDTLTHLCKLGDNVPIEITTSNSTSLYSNSADSTLTMVEVNADNAKQVLDEILAMNPNDTSNLSEATTEDDHPRGNSRRRENLSPNLLRDVNPPSYKRLKRNPYDPNHH